MNGKDMVRCLVRNNKLSNQIVSSFDRVGALMDLTLSFNVVFPLFVYMFIGIIARRAGLLDPDTCSKMNGFNFKVLFGVNMFKNVFTAREAFSADSLIYPAISVIYAIAVFLLLYFIIPIFWMEKPRASCIIQGGYRGNSMLFAIPVVEAICGADDAALASMCVSIVVPLYNILAVVLFETMRDRKVSVWPLIKSIFRNPLIIGAIAGGVASVLSSAFGFDIPKAIMTPISVLSSMNSPLSLILLGAGLSFSSLRSNVRDLAIVCFIKLIAVPAGIAAVCIALGIEGTAFVSLFAIFCVPTAVSSFPMAEQMGGDGPFAAEVIAATSLLSLFTVFLWIALLQSAGLIIV